jgi:hypothetical protein
VLERGKPLTYRGYKVWKFDRGAEFDLGRWPQEGGEIVDVIEGTVRPEKVN